MKVTLKQANNVVALINTLQSVKDAKFNFSSVCTHTVNGNPFDCGSTACAYGYIPEALPNLAEWRRQDDDCGSDSINYDVVRKGWEPNEDDDVWDFDGDKFCEELFGMNSEECWNIFWYYNDYGVSSMKDVTRQMVINRLKKYLDDSGYKMVSA